MAITKNIGELLEKEEGIKYETWIGYDKYDRGEINYLVIVSKENTDKRYDCNRVYGINKVTVKYDKGLSIETNEFMPMVYRSIKEHYDFDYYRSGLISNGLVLSAYGRIYTPYTFKSLDGTVQLKYYQSFSNNFLDCIKVPNFKEFKFIKPDIVCITKNDGKKNLVYISSISDTRVEISTLLSGFYYMNYYNNIINTRSKNKNGVKFGKIDISNINSIKVSEKKINGTIIFENEAFYILLNEDGCFVYNTKDNTEIFNVKDTIKVKEVLKDYSAYEYIGVIFALVNNANKEQLLHVFESFHCKIEAILDDKCYDEIEYVGITEDADDALGNGYSFIAKDVDDEVQIDAEYGKFKAMPKKKS